jgi:hypothetical protein
MNNNNLITSFIISLIFLIFKFIEMKYINKENIPLKIIFKNTLVIFLCSLIGIYIVDMINNNIKKIIQPTAYTGNPDF